jgi:hypothetical protein
MIAAPHQLQLPPPAARGHPPGLPARRPAPVANGRQQMQQASDTCFLQQRSGRCQGVKGSVPAHVVGSAACLRAERTTLFRRPVACTPEVPGEPPWRRINYCSCLSRGRDARAAPGCSVRSVGTSARAFVGTIIWARCCWRAGFPTCWRESVPAASNSPCRFPSCVACMPAHT